jgi:hypothetical protein
MLRAARRVAGTEIWATIFSNVATDCDMAGLDVFAFRAVVQQTHRTRPLAAFGWALC